MDIENMKNMVVLKNLPSNIVEEAIVIFKPNVKVKNSEVNENNKKVKTENSKKYILNEAEMIIGNYISKIETDNNKKMKANKIIEDKYKRLKIVSAFLGIMLFASFFVR